MTEEALAPGQQPVVVTSGLGRRFGRQWALAHCDLTVSPGECVAIAGHNGSGKTTLLRLLAGLLLPSAGSARVFGQELAPRTAEASRLRVRARCSFLSHDSTLYPRLCAREMVQVWARLLGEREAASAPAALLHRVGLAAAAEQRIAGFSAGMRKRLQLLRLELERPDLVLLDEPLAALDRQGQELVAGWIARFRSAGTTLLLATHQLERDATLADRGIVLRAGQIVWQGRASDLAAAAAEAG